MKYYLIMAISSLVAIESHAMMSDIDLELGRAIEDLIDHNNALEKAAGKSSRKISIEDVMAKVGIPDNERDNYQFIQAQLINLNVVQYNHICDKIKNSQMEQADAKAALLMELMRESDMQNKLKNNRNQQLAATVANRNKRVKAAGIFSGLVLAWAVSATIWAAANQNSC